MFFPFYIFVLINYIISNIVPPQESGFDNDNNSTLKIVKPKKQLKDERKRKCNKSYPPFPALSSVLKMLKRMMIMMIQNHQVPIFITPSKKSSIELCKVTLEAKNNIKNV